MGWFVLFRSTLAKWVIGFVAVLLLFLAYNQYIRSDERQEIEKESIKQDKETEERINDAVRTSPTDADSSLEWLRDRQESIRK